MITLLQKYLTINTAHPHPDYQAVIALFKQQALEDGFLVTEVVLPSGNPVLIITLQGSSHELPALALNHHMDVVAADNINEWLFPPFCATIDKDIIYGRGTQDCKGLGVAHYAALKMLQQYNPTPARTVHCILVPDEEIGGFHGTKEFIEHPLFASLNIGYVLDEGMPSGHHQELLIKTNERTPLQIRVTSSGSQSHASVLSHDNCIHTLTRFLATITTAHQEQQKLLSCHQAGDLMSMHITSLSTNTNMLNVIPSQAHATIDIRIPSHMSLDDGVAFIDLVVEKHPSITYEILATSTERCKPIDRTSTFYQTVVDIIARHGLRPKPYTFEATTDARFYSHHGIQALGFSPFTSPPNLHGTNESISITDFAQGITILYDFLRAFCTNHI